MKKIFIVVLALFFINFPILYCDASTEETIQEQQSEFQIQDFIKNAKQYSGEFFERGPNWRYRRKIYNSKHGM